MAYAPKSIEDGDAANAETMTTLSLRDKMPEFVGGQDSLMSFVRKNINQIIVAKNKEAINKSIEVQVTIDKKGNVKTPKITKGINAEVDKEVLRVVSSMPKWNPGTTNGLPVSKQISFPVQLK